MTPSDLLTRAASEGVHVRPDAGLLRWRGPATPELVELLREHKPALLNLLAELDAEAGEDWGHVAEQPDRLAAFASLVAIDRQRSAGTIPPHYTSTTTCRTCGPVPAFPGCPPVVAACMWCRHGGAPYARRDER